ncbi:MAG: motility protein A [Bacillota bacterium]
MKIDFQNKNLKLPVMIILGLLMVHSIVGSISLKAFFNVTALEIIAAGILLSVIISFSFETLLNTVYMVKASFFHKIDYASDIYKIHSLAVKIKKDGVLSISSDISGEDHIFLRDAMTLLNDYKKPEVMQDIMKKDIESRKIHLYRPYNVLKMVAHVAPSFGLVGTLLGLIGLLSNMAETQHIMNNMASALVSTLYGSLIANFIAVPLMGRLKEYIDKNVLHYQIIMEGILLIAKNDSARNVFDKMNVMLKEDERLTYPRRERTADIYEYGS